MGDTRFLRWYRTIPITLMAIVCALTFGFSLVPDNLVRSIFYPVKYADIIQEASDRYGVDPYLVCAVIKCESNWNPTVQSDAGAQGLMQLMPATSQELATLGSVDSSTYDPTALTDPTTNIEYGTAYLAYLQANLNATDEVIAAYNAGLGSVSSWQSSGGDISNNITYAETAAYLVRVKDAYAKYQELYPNGITDSN